MPEARGPLGKLPQLTAKVPPSGGTATGSRSAVSLKETAQLAGQAVTRSRLDPRNERNGQHPANQGGGTVHIRRHGARGLAVLQIPHRGLVIRLLFPPTKAKATTPAGPDGASNTAATIDLLRAATHPDQLADALRRNAVRDALVSQQRAEVVGTRRCGGGLEPRVERIDEAVVVLEVVHVEEILK